MIASNKKLIYRKGAVTFLDVLGWKGIWNNHPNALAELVKFISNIRDDIDLFNYNYNVKAKLKNRNKSDISTEVKSISDTIVLFTEAKEKNAEEVIRLHADYCAYVLEEALKRKFPLRGAISYGKYDNSLNIMIGPAVDEAAAWHESTDWIGVILTPSAQMALKSKDQGMIITYDNIPFKKNIKGLKQCVFWDYNSDALYRLFMDMGPHMQDVAPKYLHTLEYINNRRYVKNTNRFLFSLNKDMDRGINRKTDNQE